MIFFSLEQKNCLCLYFLSRHLEFLSIYVCCDARAPHADCQHCQRTCRSWLSLKSPGKSLGMSEWCRMQLCARCGWFVLIPRSWQACTDIKDQPLDIYLFLSLDIYRRNVPRRRGSKKMDGSVRESHLISFQMASCLRGSELDTNLVWQAWWPAGEGQQETQEHFWP